MAIHRDARFSRRRFAALIGSALATPLSGACHVEPDAPGGSRLVSRPRADATTADSITGALGIDIARDAFITLPATRSAAPLPLLVLLHGAGGSGDGVIGFLGEAADDAGVVVLAPSSRASTWDAIRSGFGRDVAFIDRALARVFAQVSIDPARVAIGGFSDGATYALSLGLMNGDLFRRIVAFSPGFVIDGPVSGQPEVFISHGTQDRILPIDRCSRVIVPALRTRGYDVTYREFDGDHGVPDAIAAEGMTWAARV